MQAMKSEGVERYPVDRKLVELVRRRTAGFVRMWELHEDPVLALLTSCYLQGAADMAKTIRRREERRAP